MQRLAVFNQATAQRAQKLGEFGEALAEQILQAAGFISIRNLNTTMRNFPFGDIYAERAGQKFVISVKIRNRFEARTGRLNARYKLGARCYELAARAQTEFSAIPAFLAVSLAADVYSAYFAKLEVLCGSRGIPMTGTALLRYECLAEDERHRIDVSHFKNSYSEKPTITRTDET